jgi:hypothetical protein
MEQALAALADLRGELEITRYWTPTMSGSRRW